jgi:1-acyl-sn-glycerol-3-phosphate acyltransferase
MHAYISDFSFLHIKECFNKNIFLKFQDNVIICSYFAVSWLLILLVLHILIYFAEITRVKIGMYSSGRHPFCHSPKVMYPASTYLALHYDTPLNKSRYEMLKIYIMTLSGFSLMRIIMFAICNMGGGLILIASYRLNSGIIKDKMVIVGLIIMRSSLWWIGNFDVQIIGCPADSSDTRIIVSNHCCSFIEIIMLYTSIGCPSFVTRLENLSLPVFSGIARISRAIFVDRDIQSSRQQTIDNINKLVFDSSGCQLMIFPEGTCNNGLALFRYNKGAFIPGLPVQPVVFNYPYTYFNPCYTGTITGGHELPALVWRMSCQFCNRVEMKYLPVYYPSEEERNDPLLYANNIQALMASHLRIPVSDATIKDYKALAALSAKSQ